MKVANQMEVVVLKVKLKYFLHTISPIYLVQVGLIKHSSDTWVAQEGFTCIDSDSNPVPTSTCAFGPAQFNPADSPTFELLANHTLNTTYGGGAFVWGPAGFDTVSVGSITVSGQEIGVPDMTFWEGDGTSEGILGLAFPALTAVDLENGTALVKDPYSPFFLSAIAQKTVTNPLHTLTPFSLFLCPRPTKIRRICTRSLRPHLGCIAFGGIVPVAVTSKSATVPVQRYDPQKVDPSSGPNATFLWYALDVDGYTFPGSTAVVTKSNSTMVDSGTTINLLPTAVADAYNA
ncbi:aspartic peptidase domain-containing protein [Roridomyces roridus]|uniref:Aspartic peptidase domain-containing protein n=1 Tax=Roridomyces roridus TaxID=1738132 RepID=A0AAD7C1X0_9AGAR|nr:aspartic peptidase domain-containing protein [Roridomyces roridus]